MRPTRPFLRWLGGKWHLAPFILPHVPGEMRQYHEPFVGSGAVMLGVLCRAARAPVVCASDANPHLVQAWRAVASNEEAVLSELEKHAFRHSYTHFLVQRERRADQECWHLYQHAAWFLYLNRASFNGLWRVRSDGSLNLSWGKKSTRHIGDPVNIRRVARLLRASGVGPERFACRDWRESLNEIGPADVAYVDPPYVGTFTGYSPTVWDAAEHEALAACCVTAAARGATVLVSQSTAAEDTYQRVFDAEQRIRVERHGLFVRRTVSARAEHRRVESEHLYVLGPAGG